jgi:thiamine biosynthesis lipoprotein
MGCALRCFQDHRIAIAATNTSSEVPQLRRLSQTFVLTILLAGTFISCQVPLHRQTRFAMSTTLTVLVSAFEEPDWPDLFDFADRQAWQFDHRREQGAIGRLNRSGHGSLPEEVLAVLQTAGAVAAASGGAFDPTILALTELWSFDTGGQLPAEAQIERARGRVDFSQVDIGSDGNVVLSEGIGLDLGGIAKGAVVDLTAEYLLDQGYGDFLIDAGGDILVSGLKQGSTPWRVAIRHPRKTQDVLGVLSLGNRGERIAVVTSGDYERYFEQEGVRYHHILDPRSGFPAQALVSVTIVASTCALADALSTAVFVLGPREGLALLEQFPAAEGLLIAERDAELVAWRTEGFPAELDSLDLQ